jgi:hypothetical protein
MTTATHVVNPFFAARMKRDATRNEACDRPVYARLPFAPKNAISIAPASTATAAIPATAAATSSETCFRTSNQDWSSTR